MKNQTLTAVFGDDCELSPTERKTINDIFLQTTVNLLYSWILPAGMGYATRRTDFPVAADQVSKLFNCSYNNRLVANIHDIILNDNRFILTNGQGNSSSLSRNTQFYEAYTPNEK